MKEINQISSPHVITHFHKGFKIWLELIYTIVLLGLMFDFSIGLISFISLFLVYFYFY
jgi:hypothetical protein